MKKYQCRIVFFIVAYIIGLLNGVNRNNYFGLNDYLDAVELFSFALPYGAIGIFLGWLADKIIHNLFPNKDTHINCPECMEFILKNAKKCKHCGTYLSN